MNNFLTEMDTDVANLYRLSNKELAERFIAADGQEIQEAVVRHIERIDLMDSWQVKDEVQRLRPDLSIKLARALVRIQKEWYRSVLERKYSQKQEQLLGFSRQSFV